MAVLGQVAFTVFGLGVTWGQVAAIGWSIYSSSQAKKQQSPTYGFDGKYNTASQQIPIPVVYGRNLVAGNTIYKNIYGEDNEKMATQIAVSEGPIKSISAIKANDVNINSKCRVKLGSRVQSADSINSQAQTFPYTAYISAELTAGEDISGNPTITSIIEGRKVKVWTGSLWLIEYSQNPAYCLLDFLTNKRYGLGINEDDIDLDSVIDSANYCDELVDGEPRFQLDYVIDFQQSSLDHIQNILATFRGFLVYSNGEFRLKIDGPDDVVQSFTMDNIVANSFQYEKSSLKDKYNRVIVEYTDPDNNWEIIGAQYSLDSDIRKNGLRDKTIQLLGINRFSQAGRAAKYLQRKAWYCDSFCAFKAGIDSIHCEAGDVVTVTHDVPGWNQKKVRILEIREDEDDEMQLVCQEYNVAVYSDKGVVQQINKDSELPNPWSPPDSITNIQLLENHKKLKDGTWIPTAEITFDLPIQKIFWKYANFFYSTDECLTWKYAGKTEKQEYSINTGLETGDYIIKIQSESSNGIKENFDNSPIAEITINGKTGISETPIVNQITGGLRGLVVFMQQPSEKDWGGFELYVDSSSGFIPDSTNFKDKGKKLILKGDKLSPGVNYYAKVRMYDESNNYSDYIEVQGVTDGETVSSTIVIAANNSSNKGKAGADFVCDGVSDQVEINNAINSLLSTGGKIFLLEGVFSINGTIMFKDNITIEGQGNSTIIHLSNDSNCKVIENGGGLDGNSNIQLKNFKIDGNKDNNSSNYGIDTDDCYNFTIENVTIENCYYGVFIRYGDNINLSNVVCRFNRYGYHFYTSIVEDGSSVSLLNCKALENEMTGLSMYNGKGEIKVIGGLYSKNGRTGILFNTEGGKVDSATVCLNGWHGINVLGGNNEVKNCNFFSNSQADDNVYQNMTIRGDNNNVQSNICRIGEQTNRPRHAIEITSSADNNLITNNDFFNGGLNYYGIKDEGTNTNFGAGNRKKDGTWS